MKCQTVELQSFIVIAINATATIKEPYINIFEILNQNTHIILRFINILYYVIFDMKYSYTSIMLIISNNTQSE